MGKANHRSFGDLAMGYQGAFHFRRSHAMARNINYVIHTAGNPIETVFVAACAVAGEVTTGELAEIGLSESLVVTVYRSHLSRPTI